MGQSQLLNHTNQLTVRMLGSCPGTASRAQGAAAADRSSTLAAMMLIFRYFLWSLYQSRAALHRISVAPTSCLAGQASGHRIFTSDLLGQPLQSYQNALAAHLVSACSVSSVCACLRLF